MQNPSTLLSSCPVTASSLVSPLPAFGHPCIYTEARGPLKDFCWIPSLPPSESSSGFHFPGRKSPECSVAPITPPWPHWLLPVLQALPPCSLSALAPETCSAHSISPPSLPNCLPSVKPSSSILFNTASCPPNPSTPSPSRRPVLPPCLGLITLHGLHSSATY